MRYPNPTVAEIDVTRPRPGVLVLADACQPGWEAWVDERPADWFCANALARGLELEAGGHRVELRYRPAWVRRGLALSGVTGVLLAGAAVWCRRRSGEV